MKYKRGKVFKVRTGDPYGRGYRVFIIARGYNDAVRLRRQFGGVIV
jgi:hypothetical protein